jgi:hypothetical protein
LIYIKPDNFTGVEGPRRLSQGKNYEGLFFLDIDGASIRINLNFAQKSADEYTPIFIMVFFTFLGDAHVSPASVIVLGRSEDFKGSADFQI